MKATLQITRETKSTKEIADVISESNLRLYYNLFRVLSTFKVKDLAGECIGDIVKIDKKLRSLCSRGWLSEEDRATMVTFLYKKTMEDNNMRKLTASLHFKKKKGGRPNDTPLNLVIYSVSHDLRLHGNNRAQDTLISKCLLEQDVDISGAAITERLKNIKEEALIIDTKVLIYCAGLSESKNKFDLIYEGVNGKLLNGFHQKIFRINC